MPWDQLVATQRAMKYILKQRDKAPRCTICDAVLFDYNEALTTYLFMHSLRVDDIAPDDRHPIVTWIFNNYPYTEEDKLRKERHHISYKKDICIYVCSYCHKQIHCRDNPKYAIYKPIDKRPKDVNKIDFKMYNPIKEEG